MHKPTRRLADRVGRYTPKHAKVVKGALETGFLFQRALVIETRLDEDPVGGIVTRQGPSFHTVQSEMTVSTGDNRADRFGHQTPTPELRVRLVTDLTSSPLFMDPIDTDRSKWRTGAPLLDQPRAAFTAAEQL